MSKTDTWDSADDEENIKDFKTISEISSIFLKNET